MLKTIGVGLTIISAMYMNGQSNPNIKRTWHWYWGHKGGMDFSNGTMNYDSSSNAELIEVNAVISDTAGNLIMYADEDTIWNKYHQVMPNGTGRIGGFSSIQGGLICPSPCNDSIYYVFNADDAFNSGANGVRYAVVNIYANGGLGNVLLKNMLLFDSCTESIGATLHANGKDVWILTERRRFNTFHLYKLDCTGIYLYNNFNFYGTTDINLYYGADAVLFSPDGKWLVHAVYSAYNAYTDTVFLYKFDNSTGMITPFLKFPVTDLDTNVFKSFPLVAFTSDSKFLYIVTTHIAVNIQDVIYRCTLNDSSAADVLNSKQLIYIHNPITEMMFSPRLTPNGDIFILDDFTLDSFPNTIKVFDSILVIKKPSDSTPILYRIYNNSKGQIPMNSGWHTFPNFISSYFNTTAKNTTPPASEPSKEIKESYIPNIFTPNGDGVNDYFSIQVKGYKYMEYTIFNRWGNTLKENKILFGTKETSQVILWDGKVNDREDAPTGVYYFIIKFYDETNTLNIQKGIINLII